MIIVVLNPNKTIWKQDECCINIACNNKLTDYEIERQPRSKKYRFCKKCRNNRVRHGIRWQCIACDNILSSTRDLLGKFYCHDKCKTRWSKRIDIEKKRYRVKKIARQIMSGELNDYIR